MLEILLMPAPMVPVAIVLYVMWSVIKYLRERDKERDKEFKKKMEEADNLVEKMKRKVDAITVGK